LILTKGELGSNKFELNIKKGELSPTLGPNRGELSSNRFGLNLNKRE
jgi:hypothetical protein